MKPRISNTSSARDTRPPANKTEALKDEDPRAAPEFQKLMKGNGQSAEAQQRDTAPQNEQHGTTKSTEREQQSDQSGSDQQTSEDSSQQPLSQADAILRSFIGESNTKAQVQSTSQSSAPADINNVVTEVADQILVSEVDGAREIRITLKDSVLPGTELRLVQEQGRMQVQFITKVADSNELLTAHQASLQTALNEKLPGRDFVVSVQSGSEASNDPNQQQEGRSRGNRDWALNDEES